MTPFRALYGRDPPTLIRGGRESTVIEVQTLMEERNHMLDELKFQLERAQNRMRTYADKKRREIEFEVGERVYLKLQPYRLRSLAKRINQKLSPRYYGPYEIVEKISPVAYKLLLPATSLVHPVFLAVAPHW